MSNTKQICSKETLMPIEKMLDKLLEMAPNSLKKQYLPINKILGRRACKAVKSKTNSPQFDNSAMDGYGLCMRDSDISKPGIHKYTLISEIFAGSKKNIEVNSGECVRIFTGARIPDGVDAVVYQEACEEVDGIIEVYKPVDKGENIRHKGEDISVGDIILKEGYLIDSYKIAEMASVGVEGVDVFSVPKVGLFFTGNELRNPGDKLGFSDIYNTNEPMLISLVEDANCEVISHGIVRDNLKDTKESITKLSTECDIIITTGGVSVGDADFVKTAIEELGEVKSWKVNMKPGKPVVIGRVHGKTIVGLPGNPVSAAVGFFVFIKPLLKKLNGSINYMNSSKEITWTLGTQAPKDRDEYVRCRLESDGKIEIYKKQGSNMIRSMSWATGLIKLKADKVYREGDNVEYYKIK